MRYLLELSKEHKTLPTSEVLACLKAEEIDYNIVESNEDVLIIETDVKDDRIKRLVDRLSLTFYINEFLFSCQPASEQIAKPAVFASVPRYFKRYGRSLKEIEQEITLHCS